MTSQACERPFFLARFRGSQRAAITGILELLSSPDYPWNPRQPLQLRIAGFIFSSREIERWTKF